DHPDNVAALREFYAARGLRLKVMIDYGVPGGRCGCRTEKQEMALANAVQAQPALALTGIEGYERVIHGDHAIDVIKAFAA
ncbi:amino acid deaminase, partial [Pseudomonas syringae pv. tagetis]